ncbi:hypothetical protein CW360_01040 [Pseudomonas fluvialis]|uniref:Glycosyltransferase 2-like domain-containing protein n=1 Tax=Pseudomonas fluvialis TaxID=1793966 RepID=A0A2I0CU65_9PSED|nr:glycosyltransferase family A protein [Pseudomonas pharmacofabricae]PKF73077.1 hypothetical protein CW360_01040 [Pseudomonas pharmacofabricae]
MQIPLTVALLTYNRANYLEESLRAILNQTYRDFELLVLDNGSTDETPSIVLSVKDERLRYVRNPPGHTAVFNFLSAIRIARGQRILVTHDDDIMEPEMLQKQMALIEARPDITAVWTNASVIDGKGAVLQPSISPVGEDRIYEVGEYIVSTKEAILWHPPSSMIFSHRLLSERHIRNMYLGSPGVSTRRATDEGDQILPAQMNLSGAVAFLSEPLLRYRRHSAQETNNAHLARTALNLFRALLRIMRKAPDLQAYEAIFQNQIVRFQAQDIVMSAKSWSERTLLKQMELLLKKGILNSANNVQSLIYLLPLIVFSLQTNREGVARSILNEIRLCDVKERPWMLALYRWAKHRCAGGNIFSTLPKNSRVVVLGSVFIAALLLFEAREAGVQVVCCLDSNIQRQGQVWFGCPIVAHSWLTTCSDPVELIILSSERDSEVETIEMLRAYDAVTPIRSWKDFAMTAEEVI